MTDKLKPALIAGGALGLLLVVTVLLSAVPFMKLIGCCNCLWPIGAGLLATMMYVKGSPTPATVVDGIILGALAGLLGGVIYLFIGLPIQYFLTGVEAMDMQVRQIDPNFPIGGAVLMIIGGLVGVVIFIVLAIIGGLIAVPIFEKRKAAADVPPPPPDNLGGGPGGYSPGV